ncbi:heparinase II/III domain-containing protein [Paenibacillus cymbidii]|uniref:heparinase II/III domain-containing protein n=1 Tax=Paenibacillus cymbidii TaxID=1639034 RepID=UPI001080EA1D|nr:heparinase II/III family protein [Paenibacillus cymbidii]
MNNGWQTQLEQETTWPVPAMRENDRILSLTIQSNIKSLLAVDVMLMCPDESNGYTLPILIEWEGVHTTHLRLGAFRPVGRPQPAETAVRMRLRAGSASLPGTELELLGARWSAKMPLIPVNSRECLLDNFQSPLFWDNNDWQLIEGAAIPHEERAIEQEWAYMKMWYLEKPGRPHRIAYTKRFDQPLDGFQALNIVTTIDRKAVFGLELRIDGETVVAIDNEQGSGDHVEFRIPLKGQLLESVTIKLAESPLWLGQSTNQQIAVNVRWLLLEREGADPGLRNEVTGMPPIPPPRLPEPLPQPTFPLGLLFGSRQLQELKGFIADGQGRRMYEEVLRVADRVKDYAPEPFVGTYAPADGGFAFNRVSAPGHELGNFLTAMLYGSLAYLLSGDPAYAVSARRSLLAVVRIEHWTMGMITRYPIGQQGYRYPMQEAHIVEPVALCYDMIYDLLTPEERELVVDAVYGKALCWSDLILRSHGEGFLLTSNQGPVYYLGFLYAALMTRHKYPEAERMLERNTEWFFRMAGLYHKPDGSTNEGANYWLYGMLSMSTAFLLLSRLRRTPVADLVPTSMKRAMDYLLHTRSLSSETLYFLPLSDGDVKNVGQYLEGPIAFYAACLDDSGARWLWHEYYRDRPIHIRMNNPMGQMMTSFLLALLLAPSLQAEANQPELPACKTFPDCGRIMIRTGSARDDSLLLFEGGPQSFEHTHHDKGQFVLEAYGELLALDPGMISYSDPTHRELTRTGMHNALTIGGRNQAYKDAARAAIVEKLHDEPRYAYICADLANSYRELTSYKRRIVFVKPYYVLVLDDIAAAEAESMEWNFHSIGKLRADGTRASAHAAKAGLELAFASSCPLAFTTTETSGVRHKGDDPVYICSNLIVSPQQQAKEWQLGALLAPYRIEEGAAGKPSIACVAAADGTYAFTATGAWGMDRIEWRTRDEFGSVVHIERHAGKAPEWSVAIR